MEQQLLCGGCHTHTPPPPSLPCPCLRRRPRTLSVSSRCHAIHPDQLLRARLVPDVTTSAKLQPRDDALHRIRVGVGGALNLLPPCHFTSYYYDYTTYSIIKPRRYITQSLMTLVSTPDLNQGFYRNRMSSKEMPISIQCFSTAIICLQYVIPLSLLRTCVCLSYQACFQAYIDEPD
jgi:hypothetical protein